MTTLNIRFKLRRATAAAWTTSNEVLLAGEAGHETDTNKLKIGDGVTAWNALAYFAPDTGGGAWGDITGTLADQTDLQNALDGKVDENAAITGAEKTKVTYDAKGLITGGTDATTADIADSLNKRYVTDADLTKLSNTSGTNTGDQDLSGKANASHTHAVSDLTQSGATTSQAIVWNGTAWAPATISASPGGSSGQVQYNNGGAFGGVAGVTYASNTMLHVSQAVGAIPLAVQAMSGQTGNLQEWRDSVGTVMTKVTSVGNATIQNLTVVGTATTNAMLATTFYLGTYNVALEWDASFNFAHRYGTNPCTFRNYRSYTNPSNYQRLTSTWNVSTALVHNEGAGTGADGSIAFNDAALATNATKGFVMLPSCAGAPSGVPTDIPTGQIPLVWDSTNLKLYAYTGGAWKSSAVFT